MNLKLVLTLLWTSPTSYGSHPPPQKMFTTELQSKNVHNFYISVNLHSTVNHAHKPIAGIEAHGPGEHKEGIRDDEHVAKVQAPRNHLGDVQLCEEVKKLHTGKDTELRILRSDMPSTTSGNPRCTTGSNKARW